MITEGRDIPQWLRGQQRPKCINKAMGRTVRKCQEPTGAASQDLNSDMETFVLIYKKEI